MYYAVLYGGLGALLAWIVMYLDTKLLDNPKEKSTYLKTMGMVGLIIAALVAFIGEENLGHQRLPGLIGGGAGAPQASGIGFVSAINEEIMTGSPNF